MSMFEAGADKGADGGKKKPEVGREARVQQQSSEFGSSEAVSEKREYERRVSNKRRDAKSMSSNGSAVQEELASFVGTVLGATDSDRDEADIKSESYVGIVRD